MERDDKNQKKGPLEGRKSNPKAVLLSKKGRGCTFFNLPQDKDKKGKATRIPARGTDVTEQHELCETLKRKSDLLDAVYKATTEGILVIGKDYRIIDCNKAIVKLAGGKKLRGAPCYRISHGYDKPCWNFGVECPLRTITKTRKRCTVIHEHKKGKETVFEEITSYPIRDRKGRTIGIVEYLKDVTKEKERNKQMNILKNAIDKTNVGVYLTDKKHRTTYVNPTGAKMLGKKPEQLIGRTTASLFGKQLNEHYLEMTGALEKKGRWKGERTIMVPGKGKRTFEIAISQTYGPQGENEGAVTIYTDSTEKKKEEEKNRRLNADLAQAKEAYARLQDIAKSVISHQALDGTIIRINKMFKEMLGDGIGKPLFEFVHPEDRGMAHEIVKNLTQGKGSSFEARALGKKGKIYLMSGYIVPVFENGKIAGSVAASEDITEERAAALRLKETMHELENANNALRDAYHGLAVADKEREDIIRIATHEAKTPLVPILGYADMLRSSKGLTNEHKRYAERIYDNTVRAVELSKKLFQVSKIKKNALKLTLKAESPQELIEHSAGMAKEYAKMRGITLTIKTDKNMQKAALDKNKIGLVLDNLLNNAIKFTNKGGSVEIGAKHAPEKGKLQFWVKDTGIGIKKESMEQIFTEFYQADSSLSRNFEGVGVGLSICKGIVEAHGGKIWAESEYKKGTKFIFTIPASGNL